ncbi:MAG: hypothetical protein OXH14_03195 [Alphaproteobacteria bacterium]|nr:hypothetical protein [Alphaproteobacteria bacterium]
MPTAQLRRLVGQAPIAAGQTAYVELPRANYLGAIELLVEPIVNATSGSISVANATLGPIPIIEHVQITIDGHQVPLAVSGEELDIWSHIDRPGSERLAISNTARGKTWSSVLRYELAQSLQNLLGAIPLFAHSQVVLEIRFAPASKIGSGNGISVGGVVRVSAEMYAQDQGLVIDTSLVHTLRRVRETISQTGDLEIELPRGRYLERLIAIVNNSGSNTWDLLDSWALQTAAGEEPYDEPTPQVRARQLRHYGGDDIPLTGVYVWDLRRGGDRDILLLGDPVVAPDPSLRLRVKSGVTLSNARVDILLEELEPASVG